MNSNGFSYVIQKNEFILLFFFNQSQFARGEPEAQSSMSMSSHKSINDYALSCPDKRNSCWIPTFITPKHFSVKRELERYLLKVFYFVDGETNAQRVQVTESNPLIYVKL